MLSFLKLAAGLAAALALGACSAGATSSTTASSGSSTTVLVTAVPAIAVEIQMVGYRYIPDDVRVEPGRVVFYLVNPSSETYAHNMVITDRAGDELARSASIVPGTTAAFTVDRLAPGVYTFSSTLEGIGYSADGTQASHGMVGRLLVLPDYRANSSTVSAPGRPDGSIQILMAASRFSPNEIVLPAGRLTFYLVSPPSEGLAHNMAILDAGGRVDAASAILAPGGRALFTVAYLPPGQYTFESTQGGPDDPTQGYQADAGMVGALTLTG